MDGRPQHAGRAITSKPGSDGRSPGSFSSARATGAGRRRSRVRPGDLGEQVANGPRLPEVSATSRRGTKDASGLRSSWAESRDERPLPNRAVTAVSSIA